jgi:hypothetical protein
MAASSGINTGWAPRKSAAARNLPSMSFRYASYWTLVFVY